MKFSLCSAVYRNDDVTVQQTIRSGFDVNRKWGIDDTAPLGLQACHFGFDENRSVLPTTIS